ncbi:MAG: hypothetical protein AAF449_01375 [Myxococcota bacterium]
MRARLLACLLGVLASATVACGDAEDPGAALSLELGTGSWRFEALEDGQEVELVRGAQGGWHVWVSFRVRGMAEERAIATLRIQPADESRPANEADVQLRLGGSNDEGYRHYIGWTGIVPDPACLVGELVRLEATMEAPDGTLLRSERDVTLLGGTYPPGACDQGR